VDFVRANYASSGNTINDVITMVRVDAVVGYQIVDKGKEGFRIAISTANGVFHSTSAYPSNETAWAVAGEMFEVREIPWP
jgi:hypothetical protein